jgi:hypothetical protein
MAVGPENVKGLRKLRPRVELHPSGKARALATEQKRHVHPDLAMRHAQCRVRWVGAMKRPSCKWKGQTVADEYLQEARVARLAECHSNKRRVTSNTPAHIRTRPHQNPPSQNGNLTQFLIHCQKQAMAEATIRTKFKILRVMTRNSIDLSNPEEVKLFIARNKK